MGPRTSLLIAVALVGCRQSSPPPLIVITPIAPAHIAQPGVPAVSPAPSDTRAVGDRVAADLIGSYAQQKDHAAAPLSLVPGDGAELAWVALGADVAIAGPIAHTELHLKLHNTERRTREGRFAITLPAGAAVSRFAMKIGSEWRESRVVSRAKGRQVYEQFLKQRVDPALLEQDAGNEFSARVFPISANDDKELILAYDTRVSASEPYTLPLHGLPPIPQLTIAIDDNGRQQQLDRSGAAPDDLVLDTARGDDATAAGEAFVARVEMPAERLAPAPLDHVLVLVDTSASRARVMGAQALLVRALVGELPPTADVVVAAYDQGVAELARGRAGAMGGLADALFAHDALGASDLGGALAYAAQSGMRRVILVGDGTPTLGAWEPAKLAALVAGSPIERIDAVQVGQSIDRDVLGPIVAAGRAPGAILDGRDAARMARQLARVLPVERAISVRDAIATWPATTRGLAAGEPVFIYGRRPMSAVGADFAAPVAVRIGDRELQVVPRVGAPPHVHREVARAEVAALTEELARAPSDGREAVRAKIEEIALANHIVSSETSLLVLESDAIEHRMLDPQPQGPTDPRAPALDPTSTTQGITIDRNYMRNIPVPGRSFEAALGAAAGAQGDALGVSFSGNTSLENQYDVDGVNTTGMTGMIRDRGSRPTTELHDLLNADVDPRFIVQQMSRRAAERQHERYGTHRDEPAPLPYVPPPPPPPPPPAPPPPPPSPFTGPMLEVMTSLAAGDRDHALLVATHAHLSQPGDVAAYLALGEALEARGDVAMAARAYGSILDLYPTRSDLVRATGERFDRLAGADARARDLAIDAYRRAVRERPDQASSYRLLAYDLMRAQQIEALDVVNAGIEHASRDSIRGILTEDSGVIAAYLLAHVPAESAEISKRQRVVALPIPTLRVVLTWETDANDVDLHVFDKFGNHSFYQTPLLASGGRLRDDVTTGFGPEMFEVDSPKGFPYRVAAYYYNRGPMGFGLGSVMVVRHDGAGNVTVDDRPFILQSNQTMVELGSIASM